MVDVDAKLFTQIFKQNDTIIINESLLSSRYVPAKIIARDIQIQKIADNLASILRHGEPNNMYIWGDTGVGKSITVRYVLNVLVDGIKHEGKDILIDTITLDCTTVKSEILACIEIITQLTGITVKPGLQFYYYLNDIWNLINKKANEHSFYTLILFFDEIDLFDKPDNILYQLSRALSNKKFTANNTAIGIIAASNKKNFLDTLRPNVLSSAKFRYIDFPNYNEDELYEILQLRKSALIDGSISDDVIRYCAKNVAERYHGDARQAIDILHQAAKIVMKTGDAAITTDDMDLAEKVVNEQFTTEMLKRLPLHDRLLILSVYMSQKVMRQTTADMPPYTGVVLLAYRKICELMSYRPNTDTHMSARIKALDDEQVMYANFIPGYGNTKYVTLPNDVVEVVDTLFSDTELQKLLDNYSDFESVILSKIKRSNKGKSKQLHFT